MSKKEIRIASKLTFDNEKEKDIIEQIERLTEKRKFTGLVEALLRIYFENPGELRDKELNDKIAEVQRVGCTPERYKYFNLVNKQINELTARIKYLEAENTKMISLFKMAEQYGLKERIENNAAATFLVSKQLKNIEKELGFERYSILKAKKENVEFEKNAEDTLEFIIENYSNVLNVLKVLNNETNTVVVEDTVVEQPEFEAVTEVVEEPIEEVIEEVIEEDIEEVIETEPVIEDTTEVKNNTEYEILKMQLEIERLRAEKAKSELEVLQYKNEKLSKQVVKESNTVKVEDKQSKNLDKQEDIVDFSNADFGALSNFFGG